MKRKQKLKKEITKSDDVVDTCYSAPPAWEVAKTKRGAFISGQDLGYEQGLKRGRGENEQEILRLKSKNQDARLQALRDVCQAGSTVVEAMSKALLSYQGHL